VELPALDGVTHRTVAVRGLELHVAEAGAGTPVVLVHGWPQHWWAWRRVVPLLAAHARLVMVDQRGFGWSSAPPDGYEKATLADDLLAALDALGLERVHLVGHDWGTYVACLACLSAPDRFERLLAMSCPLPLGSPSPRQARELWRFAYQLLLVAPVVGERLIANEGFTRALLRRAAASPDTWTEDELRTFSAVLAEPGRARASVQLYRTFLVHEAGRTGGGHLRVPTHLMTGERDPAVRPVLLEGAERHADELTIETVPGCGHYLPEERPELVAERVLCAL
jgi:pimeloyl-ACP methyl ester carboxylesterase